VESLGSHLHKLREDKGFTYKKVFEDLRLREDQIRLIEADRFPELGPYGLVKALVYRYARYLEADVEAVMNRFEELMPSHTHKLHSHIKHEKQKKIMLSTNFLWTIGIIIFILILASILWYAYRQDWLKTPDLFKASAADTTVVKQEAIQESKPDSLRLKMRQLSESIAAQPESQPEQVDRSASAFRDSTDYLGSILGSSQINIPLH